MGYSNGYYWRSEIIDLLRDLKLSGLSDLEVANHFSAKFNHKFSPDSIEKARKRHLRVQYAENPPETLIPIYKPRALPDDNYMVSCDQHGPYHLVRWTNYLLEIADRFKIRKHVIVGDLFDFDFIKHYYTEKRSELKKELAGMKSLIGALGYFDTNYLIQGNHERRIGIQTGGNIKADDIFSGFGDAWTKKFEYTEYDRMFVGDKWLVVHPKSYSQISGSVAVRLAEKYHRHVINAHGHFIALRYDRSGEYMAIDLGGLFDVSKIDYINLRTTTHPAWNPGFLMLLDGHAYHFHEGTDWKYWLGGNGKK